RFRARTAGERLVGRRGRAPRLLRHRNLAGPARLGLRPAGRAGPLDAAGVVFVNAFLLPPPRAGEGWGVGAGQMLASSNARLRRAPPPGLPPKGGEGGEAGRPRCCPPPRGGGGGGGGAGQMLASSNARLRRAPHPGLSPQAGEGVEA